MYLPARPVRQTARVPELPDLTTAEQAAFARKFALDGPLIRVPSTGIVNRVYRAARGGRDVALRVPLPGDAEDTLTESVAVPVTFRAGVRTPELLVFDDDRDVVDAPVTVYAFVGGRSLDALGWAPDDPRAQRAWREAGRELARLHARVREVPDPHGWLDVVEGVNPSRVRARVTAAERLSGAAAGWATDTVRRLLRDAPGPARPAFLHNDLHAGNLMVHPDGTVSALIDWGDAGWGDPAVDLCYAGPLATPFLLQGYEEAVPGQLGAGVTLRVLAFLLDHATRALTLEPQAHQDGELWYVRPGTALMDLLRVSGHFPEWRAYLGGGLMTP